LLPFTYHPAPDLGVSPLKRLARFPRQPDLLAYALRAAGAVVLRAALSTYCRLRIVGRQQLPEVGPFVLACNHTSHLDALCLLSALPLGRIHRAYPAAAADYFFSSLYTGALSGLFLNALPFHRKTHVRQTLELLRNLIADASAGQDHVLIVFPEGTRSPDGRLQPFRPGIGDLVAGTPVPVLPCHLAGGDKLWPRNRAFPRPGKLTLTIGEPRTYVDRPRTREAAYEIAQELEDAVRELGNPLE